ncbi:unnamed protein product, partial [Rotaria sp. Silwood2]
NDKDFDQEFLSRIQTEYAHDICAIPKGIQAQTASKLQIDVSYAVSWKTTNSIIAACISRTPGIDFRVRFCCPNSDFITTTTAAPRPIDSRTCGREQRKP